MRASALILLVLPLAAGCKPAPAPAGPATTEAKTEPAPTYPSRPTVAPLPFHVVHKDEDTYTLVTTDNATDDQVAAILWQLHDANQTHTFDKLHLSQKFIDARQPKVWIHLYRGAKCANEKYTTKEYPCGASYHGAGDLTFGGYKNPAYEEAVLHPLNNAPEQRLWNPDAPPKP